MDSFKELLEIADILHSPQGCPWDREQTFESLLPFILEEVHEVLEAVDNKNEQEMIEELGDLFYTVIFFAKVAERENRFSIKTIIEALKAKLIRRHPHVFGEEKAQSVEDVIQTWEKVKQEEKKDRKSLLDGIPKTLSSLQRAQKILQRIRKHKCPKKEALTQDRAEELAQQILSTVHTAIDEEIDIESVFRKALSAEEKHFKEWELQSRVIHDQK